MGQAEAQVADHGVAALPAGVEEALVGKFSISHHKNESYLLLILQSIISKDWSPLCAVHLWCPAVFYKYVSPVQDHS